MQVPGAGPEGREGLPPPPGFFGFGTEPEPLPKGSEETPPPVPLPPDAEFEGLPPGFVASAIALPELRPPPGLVAVTGGPAAGDRAMGPEPAANGSEEDIPLSLWGFPPPGPEEGFVRSAIAVPELRLPPGLVAVTGGPAAGDRAMGLEAGFNGSEEGEGELLFSGLFEDLGFPASAVKSVALSAPLGRDWVTGGSLLGGSSLAIGLSFLGGSGDGVLGSLAIGLGGVSGGIKSCLGAIAEGCSGIGGGVAATGGCSGIGGGVAATGGSSGIGGGVAATGGSSGIGGGVAATGCSSGIGGGVTATGCSSGIGGGVTATGGSSGGVGSGGGSGLNVSGGGDTFSGIAGSGLISSTFGSSSMTISMASSANSAGLTNLRLNGSITACSMVEASRPIARIFLRASSSCCLCVAEIFEKLMPDESPSLDCNYSHLLIFYIASLSYHLAFCFAVCVTHAGAVRSRILAEKIPKFLNRNTLSHTLPKKISILKPFGL